MKKWPGKALLGVFLFLLVLLFAGYYKLGGFNPVQVELVEVDNYHLAGRYFEGSYESDTVGMYFNQMKEVLGAGVVEGNPVIIYHHEPTDSSGLSMIFVGILLSDTEIEPLPSRDLIRIEIDASTAIRVSKKAHISVMPNPDKIDKLIEAYARDHRVKIAALDIEIYHSDNRLVIERPVDE
ncbi:MAG: hypothetical protein DHS20C17_18420 [Cyclobacteriaceae bacterium]|nr:MAG: hypothetical protein DHS20C17_18420 [Cyclobacteriaceae bacterium]